MKKPNIKKYLMLIAFWAFSMIAIIGGSYFYKKYQGIEYDKLAVPYIEKTVPVISSWDPAETKALMAPEIAETIPADKFVRAMSFFSQLGSLKELGTPSFVNAYQDEETEIGKQTIIEYNVDAVYQNGEAEINLKLLERGDSYEIYRFNFSSQTLMPKKADKE